MHLVKCFQQIHALRDQTAGILGQVSDAESAGIARNRLELPLHYKNEKEIEMFELSCCLNMRTFWTVSRDFLLNVWS